jgi:hypothetical protein
LQNSDARKIALQLGTAAMAANAVAFKRVERPIAQHPERMVDQRSSLSSFHHEAQPPVSSAGMHVEKRRRVQHPTAMSVSPASDAGTQTLVRPGMAILL